MVALDAAPAMAIRKRLRLWGVREFLSNHVTVVNLTGQTIKRVAIRVGGRVTEFENIPVGASASGRFRIVSDDALVVRGELADGTPIDDSCGYLTQGMYREQATLTIGPTGNVRLEHAADEPQLTHEYDGPAG